MVKRNEAQAFVSAGNTGGALAAGILHAVSYTHLRAHETVLDLVCRLLLEKTNKHNTHTHTHTKKKQVKRTYHITPLMTSTYEG